MKHHNSRLLRQGSLLLTLCVASLCAAAQTPAPQASAAPAAAPSTDEGSYLVGESFGVQLHQVGVTNEVSMEAVVRGLKDALAGKKLLPADQQRLQQFIGGIIEKASSHNEEEAKAYLAKNGAVKGVKTTASGLQYKVVAAGDSKAASPTPTDTVTVQYTGKLIDGTEFDSSYSRGQPATFPVNGVIKGWQEALVLMKPGAKWQLFVPPDLAYGKQPRPGIPGGSLLVFDVELLSVKAAPPAAAVAPAPAPKSP